MSRWRGWLLLLPVLLLVTAGCVDLPTEGAVRTSPVAAQADQDEPFDFTPGGPKPGATPVEIVNGFMTAMTATPLTTFVARQFLTAESATRWQPENGTVVYGNQAMTATPGGITMRLGHITELDDRGAWLGDPTHGAGARYGLRLMKEKGQWRITNPPNRLVIPQSHFNTRFGQYYLYFFDAAAQVLVPEPVYLPSGVQAPTLLVAGLLRGPDRRLRHVERTFFPTATHLGDISVPVTRDGVADVPLSSELLGLRDEDLNLAYAQLAWTLEQLPGLEKMRVTVDGSPLGLPGSAPAVSLSAWSEFDPAVAWASQSLFGVRDGRAVAVTDGRERRVSGPLGAHDYGLRSLGADLPGRHLAGVTVGGGRLLVAQRSAVPGGGAQAASTVLSGASDLLRPTWDLYGQIWLLDRTATGAVLRVVRKGVPAVVTAPGITGADVRRFVLSRDGTRLVAQVRAAGRDSLVIARVQRDATGGVRRLSVAEPLPLTGVVVRRIRDVGWRTPGSVAVLATTSTGASQIVVAKVDGSSALGDAATDLELFSNQAVSLVTSPSVGAPLYIGTRPGRLFELAGNGRWMGTGITAGLSSPAFVG